jgi:Transcriptional regulator
MRGRQLQAQETKRRIFQSAIGLMAEKGYHGTKIEEICQAAEVSIGAFYHHFKSKDDIFSVTYEEADAYFEAEVASRLRVMEPCERVLGFFAIYAEFNRSQGLEQCKVLFNADNRWFIKQGRGMQKVLAAQIAECQSLELIDSSEEPESITIELFVLARGVVYDWCLHDGGYDLAAEMRRLVERMLRGYASSHSPNK